MEGIIRMDLASIHCIHIHCIMSFASMTASGVISEPTKNCRTIRGTETEVMNFNLYVKPKNKNNGYGPDENMCFQISIWNKPQIDTYYGNIKKGQEVTLQGNFEVNQFTTKQGEIVRQNRIDFASIIGVGTSTEQREVIREFSKTKKDKLPKAMKV